ncbi:5'-methylthioadenosine/S-adenosylhomocysteine nucleosidase [Agrobacterium tumefaciens]|uniref:5'-methylthioadenosine/S-adenosylhomocysteine nucleosidase n=1 Tax=Agrobacterium tumefaciens TaxID=358 RepID=A0AAP9E5L0_AGRTU|nr:5'-methylthioadenosine/S-adenosylhomocysteine nucleosidase [Agrobacterium tumefaciens]NSZ56413.1 5'-methylthioadenosine/S-adenosylhomocysteine nucleosidase [Agrobacterium tumefaciens]QDY95242.1 5'-methylthioadenosine/S-adenosylhomocysteine nucleosidase [Agrobacterium tumefaciens]UXS50391.1 5'-methylthioadenosine/S-adenosylhomocysteine nucleosidase [Agrobacterium tumefaciens]UXS71638.1 5'-methylthioadenosine/S-adenosylhomocysteine nucleosidase [Agrobacterium tumefaciens]UXS79306.1 5'-methylt
MNYRLLHVADKSVLFVMAASAEYGPHLQARIAPLMTGVGPVEAAISVTAVLAGLDAADHLPDLVVSLGSAGSRTLDQTGVYQAISVSYRDMDASAFGFEKGRTPFLDLPADVPLPFLIPGIAEARLSTGANVVSGAAYGEINADMVEMETYAVLRACQRFGVPLAGLRGISDGKADVNHVDDWTEYLHIIDEKLAEAVDGLCRAIEDGTIAL